MLSQGCVKNFVHGGVYTSIHWVRHPLGRHPPFPADTLRADTPLGRHQSPRADAPKEDNPLPIRRLLQRTVRILLERILVFNVVFKDF